MAAVIAGLLTAVAVSMFESDQKNILSTQPTYRGGLGGRHDPARDLKLLEFVLSHEAEVVWVEIDLDFQYALDRFEDLGSEKIERRRYPGAEAVGHPLAAVATVRAPDPAACDGSFAFRWRKRRLFPQ